MTRGVAENTPTPPSEEALLFDLEYTKRIGCNMVRKHVKVEPLRWYYACDRIGLIVWQDMPNGGPIDGETVAVLAQAVGFHRTDTHCLRRFGRAEEADRAPLIERGLAAAIYTQTTDVETEINGYLTYDRRVEKMDAEILRQAHENLIARSCL